MEPKIINISSRNLSQSEITLLEKGLKFTPTPIPNTKELKDDLQEFGRKLRLLEHFDSHGQQPDTSLVKNKSNYVPPLNNDRHLQLCLENISKLHEESHGQTKKSNVSLQERKALKSLKTDKSIIIKQADKGGATVIMDKSYYKSRMLEMLSDTDTYLELKENEDNLVMKKIKRLTKQYEHELTKKEIDYLQNFSWKSSNFYGLPKIHKSKEIKTVINEQNSTCIKTSAPNDLPFRPIVAGPCSPTHRLSNLIDIILKPLCKEVPSYIRDDLEFLNHIPNEVEETTILVTFDVINLYTSIPHDLGLDVIKFWLENYRTSLTRPFSTEFILDSISIILKENTFQFDEKQYKQIQGTAMGTKMAPTYATLVMGYLEKLLYASFERLFGLSEAEWLVKHFKRFLDDCSLLWNKSKQKLNEFHQLLNGLHPKIKFTMEHSTQKLPFLDILLCKQGRKMYTDIYYKPTDTHQYLDFRSCHPKHTKTNIPYNLARRICTIVIEQDLREQRLNELKELLEKQNYPEQIITKGIAKAKKLSVEDLRLPREKIPNTKSLPLVVTNNPNNPQILGKVKENLNILQYSKKMKNIMSETKFIVSYRQPKNLKQELTKAEFSSSEISTPMVSKCDEKRCGTCDVIQTGNSITFKNGKKWHIKAAMNCTSRNVIYVIICTKCQSFYVGQTENLRNRVTVHKEQINHDRYRHLYISQHLKVCSNGEFKICPIYRCKEASRLKRESKEKEIIDILNPDLNT